jgi:hypothetical protein
MALEEPFESTAREHLGGPGVLLLRSRCHGGISLTKGSRYGPSSCKRADPSPKILARFNAQVQALLKG